MQSGPAQKLYGTSLEVKILGQYGLNVLILSRLVHWFTEFNYTTKFVVAAILRVGQNELRVVLGGHGVRLRLEICVDCEPDHKFSDRFGRHDAKSLIFDRKLTRARSNEALGVEFGRCRSVNRLQTATRRTDLRPQHM